MRDAGFWGDRSMAWQRPTLPRVVAQYHGCCGVSRPSSEWDRVGHPRLGHQAIERSLLAIADPLRAGDAAAGFTDHDVTLKRMG